MGIQFKVRGSDLNAALDVVSIVPPRPFDKAGAAGYLFVVRGEMGYVYSRDEQHVARHQFPLSDVEGEGAFVYPAAYIGAFRSLVDDEISFSVVTDPDKYSVSYSVARGARAEKTSYDPKVMQGCDKDLADAKESRTFPVAILREALSLSRHFCADVKDQRVDDKQKTLQIFDKGFETDDPKHAGQKHKPYEKGDGYLQASNGTQLISFYSEAFLGKQLALHAKHLPLLQAFFAKCKGDITLSTGANMTFATDTGGRVLGWTHHSARLPKYSSYALSQDHLIFKINCDAIMAVLKYVRTELEDKREKIKLVLDATACEIKFQVAEGPSKAISWPVPFTFNEETTPENKRNVELNVNLTHFMALFEGVKSSDVMLRISVVPPSEKRPKDSGMLRTMDEFLVDSAGKVVGGSDVKTKPDGTFTCKVTRFTPSML